MKNSNSARRFLGFLLAITGFASSAQAVVVSATGTVTFVISYATFGGGDFLFRTSSLPAGCEAGFWLSQSQPGFKESVAFVLQSRATGEAVIAGGDTAQLWSGSSGHYCKVDYVGTPY